MYLYQVSSREQFIIRESKAHKSPGSPNSRKSTNSHALLNSRRALDSRRARDSLKQLTDNRLVSQLEKLRGEERAVQLKILCYLNEIERRRLYLPRGYSSLFEFCTGHLKYSKPAVWRRIQAARCIERFPRAAKLLLSGRLSLTTVSMISKILTPENATEILSWAGGKSTRDIELLVSHHQPAKMQRDRVKPVCIMIPVESRKPKCQADLTFSSGAGTKCKASLTSNNESKLLENKSDAENIGDKNPSGEKLERVLIEQCFKLEFMVKAEFMKKVERMKALLSNKYPKGLEFERLFEILMDEYLEKHLPEARAIRREKRKRRGSDKNNSKVGRESNRRRSTSDSDERTRYIPSALKDKVHTRDKGRCSYIGKDGKRCNSRWNLQVDHIVPYAKGGNHTLDNLRLLCAKHNRLEAESEYGVKLMKQYVQKE